MGNEVSPNGKVVLPLLSRTASTATLIYNFCYCIDGGLVWDSGLVLGESTGSQPERLDKSGTRHMACEDRITHAHINNITLSIYPVCCQKYIGYHIIDPIRYSLWIAINSYCYIILGISNLYADISSMYRDIFPVFTSILKKWGSAFFPPPKAAIPELIR